MCACRCPGGPAAGRRGVRVRAGHVRVRVWLQNEGEALRDEDSGTHLSAAVLRYAMRHHVTLNFEVPRY